MLLRRPMAARRARVFTALTPHVIQRAPLFSFLKPSQALVKSHTETRVVPFSCSEMFDVVADVERYSDFLPFCVESRVLRRPNENVMEAALRVGFNIFTESYTSRVLMIRPNKIATKAIDSPTFKRIESEWMFKPCETPGSCEIAFRVTFEVSSFLHANAIQLFFDDVALTQLNAFIGRARKTYGSKPRSIPHASAKEESPTVQSAAKSTATNATESASLTTDGVEAPVQEAEATVSRRTKGGISTQTYRDLANVFDDYADKNGKLYYGGFMAACMALSDEYEDMKDVSESATLAGAVFSSFETHTTPKDWLTLDEFVVGVYLMTKGTFEQKAHNLFEIVNATGSGKITREELTLAMQRRIRAVKKLFPKLLRDQVQIQMGNKQSEELSSIQDAAVANGVKAIEQLMEAVEKDIPLAVNQIFREADLDQDDYIREQEWMFAWQAHPEFVELLTIDGMKKMAQWASVVQEASIKDDEDDDDKTNPSGQSLDTRLMHVD
uniref:EF-hand domain-containing protein n=1 Tax=Peronospora matthiolae TaxID=2874970 RepID=A0AAV1UX68_9STRA